MKDDSQLEYGLVACTILLVVVMGLLIGVILL